MNANTIFLIIMGLLGVGFIVSAWHARPPLWNDPKDKKGNRK
jgi:hypothetical protein